MKCIHEINNRIGLTVSFWTKKPIKSYVLKEGQLDETGFGHDNYQ
jgi:hypothetical protein